jgi:P protein
MIASTLSIAFLAALDDRPTHEEIIGWIDVETILLLFSMMILVGIMSETGVFNHIAVYAYKVQEIEFTFITHLINHKY